MTIYAGCRRALKAIGMTAYTIHRVMCSGQWKLSSIVIKNYISISCRMASQTSIGLINIAGNTNMHIIGLRILVTSHTSKFCIIGWVGVALITLHPCALVFSTVYREILTIVVKGGGLPGRFTMTSGTICWKLSLQVIGICGGIVI